jgi:hypothetical protein
MSNQRHSWSGSKGAASTLVGANQAAAEVSSHFTIKQGESILVAVRVKLVTNASGTALVKLQHATQQVSGVYNWTDVKSSAFLTTAAGEAIVEIRSTEVDAGQVAKHPLGPIGRVVAVTGAGDTVTVMNVAVIQ